MKGYQLKQRNHPAQALASQIDFEQKKKQGQNTTVAALIDGLGNKQKWFALGYLAGLLEANKEQ